jgi:hypothetical protein
VGGGGAIITGGSMLLRAVSTYIQRYRHRGDIQGSKVKSMNNPGFSKEDRFVLIFC